ncbi:MAG: HAD-IA family hydrolase [Candidatus Saccharimonadales bacterium]
MSNGGSYKLERALGQRIQSMRLAAGLTQQRLCNQANISYSTLTKIERGAIKSPSIFTVQAIAEAIGVSLDKLIGTEKDKLEDRQLTKSNSGISFVYFDVNGCLVRFYQRAFRTIAEEFDIAAEVVETAFWHYNDQACRGTLSMDEFNAKLAKKIGVRHLNWPTYYLRAAESVPETSELIKWVYKHYKIGLLTNIMPGLLSALRRSKQIPDLDYDAIVDSSEIGHIKPEPKMYTIAEEKSGVNPDEILLVDDTRANLSAAEDAGWHVLWFDYANPKESVEQIRQTLKVNERV